MRGYIVLLTVLIAACVSAGDVDALYHQQATLIDNAKIGIVGAGIAGIQAGKILSDYGIEDWVILETKDDIGGRLYTKPLGNDGTMVEGCAMWIQGLGGHGNKPINPIWDLIKNSDITCHQVNWNNEAIYGAHGEPSALPYTALDRADSCVVGEIQSKIIAGEIDDISTMDAWRLCGFEPNDAIERTGLNYYHDFEWAESPFATSTLYTADFATYGIYGYTDCLLTDNRGYVEVARQIMDNHYMMGGRHDARVILSATVVNINTDKQQLTMSNKKKYSFDKVINTIPLGPMQYAQRGKSNQALFTPEWSFSRQKALEGYHMATYNKIYMRFSEVFWDQAEIIIKAPLIPNFHMFVSVFDDGTQNAPRPNTGILCIQQFSETALWSDEMETQDIVDLAMVELRMIYGNEIPEPDYISSNHLSEDPAMRYSYSNIPVGFTDAAFNELFAPIGDFLYFAGEANCRILNGYVHGGYLSGETAALRILQDLKTAGDPRLANTVIPDPFDNDCWIDPRLSKKRATESYLGRRTMRTAHRAQFDADAN